MAAPSALSLQVRSSAWMCSAGLSTSTSAPPDTGALTHGTIRLRCTLQNLLVRGHPSRSDRRHESVEARPDDSLCSEVVQDLPEEERGAVVLRGSLNEPVGQQLP